MDSKLSPENCGDYFSNVDEAMPEGREYTCYLCSASYEKDLQLAAELGKTLLERNKELETAIKNHQNIIEDQSQEIEYLTKQTTALKEVNASRIKIYEQLEISIQDLEHTNDLLMHQNLSDKKHIKSLLETVELLENQREELQNSCDKISVELENERRQRILNDSTELNENNKSVNEDHATDFLNTKLQCPNCMKITSQLEEFKVTNVKNENFIVDLKEQMALLLQENNYLQDQLETSRRKDDEFKNVQEKLSTLEQIRLGNLCKRCLKNMIPTEECSSTDDLSLVLTNEDETEITQSIASAFFINDTSSPTLEAHADNPYRILVEKYESLLKMQEQHQQKLLRQKINNNSVTTKPCMSLHDELQLIGNYYDSDKKYQTDSEIEDESEFMVLQSKKEPLKLNQYLSDKRVNSTPFFGNICHQSTQTDVSTVLSGSFLCKISDGNDCQFSIYDDASPVESRFRKTPEYRQLFKEIFAVLKRAAEAKDEGESLPLLGDRSLFLKNQFDVYQQCNVPLVTSTKKVESSILVNENIEASLNTDKTLPENDKLLEIENFEEKQKLTTTPEHENRPDIMQQLMQGIKSYTVAQKQNTNKYDKKNSAVFQVSPSLSPSHSRSGSGKRRTNSRARKKRERFIDSPHCSKERHQQKSNKPVETCFISDVFEKFDSKKEARNEKSVSGYTVTSSSSAASKEVAKLKILEKSYAEVLRLGRKKSITKTSF